MSIAKKVIRINPITGEEIHYIRGSANNNNNNSTTNIKPSNESSSLTNNSKLTVRDLLKPQEKQSKSDASSMVANATSVPILNFADLLDSDSNRPNVSDFNSSLINKKVQQDLNKYKLEKLQSETKLNDFKMQNPIVAPVMVQQQESARPKSSYRQGYVNHQANSPILAYLQQKQHEPSPLASKLEAPRDPSPPDLSNILPIQPARKEPVLKIERVADLELYWINSGPGLLTPHTEQIKNENDEKTKFLKEKLVVDTVLTDQLNRLALPDGASSPRQMKTIYTSRGNKFNVLDSHSAAKYLPSSAISENLLAKRCKFNCRVKTPDGKLALKELFGILFLYDGSLTIYEFRLLCGAYFTGNMGGSGSVSKKANALPFIQRKAYTHLYGRRKGNKIEIWDIYKGALLYLVDPTGKRHLEIEVTDVDEVEKENLLSTSELLNTNLSSDEMSHNILYIKERLKQPMTPMELNDQKIITSVRIFMRKQIEDRAVECYMGLSKCLKTKYSPRNRSYELYEEGLVSREDLYEAFNEYSVKIHSEDLNIVWQVIDLDACGYVHYYKVMRAYFGEMNITRHACFRNLVLKIDTLKSGYVQINDIYKYYKANRHPKVKSGEMTENQMYERFLGLFDLVDAKRLQEIYGEQFYQTTAINAKTQFICYDQLEQYYNGLSIAVADDQDFLNILKHSWNFA